MAKTYPGSHLYYENNKRIKSGFIVVSDFKVN